jgi:hypothetical protein
MLCPKHGSSNPLNHWESIMNRAQPKSKGTTWNPWIGGQIQSLWGSETKMHKTSIHDPHKEIWTQTPHNRRNKIHMKNQRKQLEKDTKITRAIGRKLMQLWMLPYTRRSNFLQNSEENISLKSREMRSTPDRWVALKPYSYIYEVSSGGQMSMLPVEHKLWYTPLRGNMVK